MNERNHWITFGGHQVAGWRVTLPPPAGDPEKLVRFGATLAHSGKRHGVWDLRRMPGLPNERPFAASVQTFENYLRAAIHDQGMVPLLPSDAAPHPEECWQPAVLAFFRGARIVEEDIGDVGELLRRLRSERSGSQFARSTAPVTIHGAAVAVDDTAEVVVQVRLDTDIWFPGVTGMNEPVLDDAAEAVAFDNRALAEVHTPRLNAFLRDLRTAALAHGGRWEMLEPDKLGMSYIDQWNEMGIRL